MSNFVDQQLYENLLSSQIQGIVNQEAQIESFISENKRDNIQPNFANSSEDENDDEETFKTDYELANASTATGI